MNNYCTGPDSSCHIAPESGECLICAVTVALFEEQSGLKYDPNGPVISECDRCFGLVQHFHLHNCDPVL